MIEALRKSDGGRLSELLGRLGEWRSEGGQVVARCPAHDDSHPSLIVSVTGEGRLLLHCRAGCGWREVAAAAGVESFSGWVADVEGAAGAGGGGRRAPVPSSGMRSALASALKTFKRSAVSDAVCRERFGLGADDIARFGLVLSPAGAGGGAMFGRSWSAVDRLVVPLRGFGGELLGAQGRAIGAEGDAPRWAHLRNVDEAHSWARFGVFSRSWSDAHVVILCEGPSDALTLVGAGFDAVAITGAALSASSELAGLLREGLSGRRVVALGDADEAGERFNAAVREIFPSALVVRPRGEDVNDWRMVSGSSFAGELRREVDGLMAEAFGRHARFDRDYWSEWSPKAHVTMSDRDVAKEFLRWVAHSGGYVVELDGEGLVSYGDGFYDVAGGERRVRSLLQDFAREAQGAQESGLFSGYEKHLAVLRRVGNSQKLSAVLTALRSIVDLVKHSDLDWDGDLLPVANGVVDLRTGALLPADRGMRLSGRLDTAFVSEAECPAWDRFVLDIMDGDAEMVGYLQRLLGYGVTGHTSEQVLAFFYGRGANGKSILQSVLMSLLGSLSTQVNYSALSGAMGGGPQPEVMMLRGSRLTWVPEASASMELEDSTVKLLTGGDAVTARGLYRDATSFVPKHLICITTNHMPTFSSGSSHGIMRRLRLVPFKRIFAPEEQRAPEELIEELLGEAEGVLRWLVEGAIEWRRGGLREPDAALVATESLREYSDVFSGFLPGPLVAVDPAGSVSVSDLYSAWEAYRSEFSAGSRRMPLKEFVLELKNRDFVVLDDVGGGKVVRGLRLNNPMFGGK